MIITIVVIYLSLLVCQISRVHSVFVETCNAEIFQASCESDEVILVTSAQYGRHRMGRCITAEEPHMGCGTDVLPLLDKWCSGRQTCEFHVANPDLVKVNQNSDSSCLSYLNMYQEVEYSCVKVESQCGANGLNQNEGILASHVTDKTGCGTTRSPWKISVNQGKTINITLIDFYGDNHNDAPNYAACRHVYGYIVERSLGINHTICGGQRRQRILYSSKTNNAEIYITARQTGTEPRFLLKFEAFGCTELNRPINAWYKREGSEAVIGCETNDQEWRLTCIGNTWQGTVGNCSTQAAMKETPKTDPKESTVGYMSVIVMTSMICAVFIAVVIAVMCGVIYLKKYRMRQETKRMQTTYATMEKQHLSYYRPVNDNSFNSNTPATDAASERLVDVPGTWMQPDTFGRHATMTSYPDSCVCPTLPGVRS